MKEFRDFVEAREFARSLGLQSTKEWRAYTKSGNKPDDIPNAPDSTYKKNFNGYGDWLGTGTVATHDRVYRRYKEAREFAIALNLKNMDEWRAYTKSGNKPDDIPSAPHKTYKKEFKGVGDWLGTGTIAARNKPFRSFTEAREFVRKLNLKNWKEWTEYCASGNKPDDIPSAPWGTYKKDYKGMGNWLGTGTVAPKDRVYRSFKEAREFAQSLGLKDQKEWNQYCASGNKPDDIPQNINAIYKKEFKGVGDWLGTGSIASFNREYRSFTEAREFVRKLNLKNWKEWTEYCASGNKPDDIPANSMAVYKNEFKGNGDWLGTDSISNRDKVFRSFEEAREFVRALNLSGDGQWREYCTSGNKPDDIPSNPIQIYKNKGWINSGDWFGTGYVANYKRKYRSFTEAREFVRKLNLKNWKEWIAYVKSGNKPDDIPADPSTVYKEWKKK
jgi:hypothetical protein